ncbi:MAG: hypothetical protein QOC87_1133, partial [Actinomycetota bacterium]|nr:hypothetical protein [Actinomycetota bacterium]
ANGVRAGKRRKQRRMKVQQTAGERVDEDGSKDPHETGRDDEVRLEGSDYLFETSTPLVARSKVAGFDHDGVDPRLSSESDPIARPVGDNCNQFSRDLAAFARVSKRDHVRAGSRDQNDEPSGHGAGARSALAKAGYELGHLGWIPAHGDPDGLQGFGLGPCRPL